MRDHKPLPVEGYTPQSAVRVGLVNENKILEERVLRQIEKVLKADFNSDNYEYQYGARWCAIAKTHIEQAFMALNRAVFQPQRISLPEDADQSDEVPL